MEDSIPRSRRRAVLALLDPQTRQMGAARAALLARALGCEVEVVERGSTPAIAIAHAAHRSLALVLLVEPPGSGGRSAVAIASALSVPVFVAREQRTHGPFVAATSMQYLRYPVLLAAARIARRLARRATFVHDVGPYPLPAIDALAVYSLANRAAHAKLTKLRILAGWAGTESEAIVIRSDSRLDSIVDVAEQQDADVVFIGSRRSWRTRVERTVAVDVVDRCRCSVFVVPTDT